MTEPYDALLIVSFGGPERMDDVMPFLENVTRGRNIPRERLLEVAEHYRHFDGVSPINAQCRELVAALGSELGRSGIDLPIYWGNRNWHPFLADTLRQMADDGVRSALAFVTAAYSSYSSCKQYRENIAEAQQTVGGRAPRIDKIRVFYNHPDFIAASADRLREAFARLPDDRRAGAHVAFTAHSIPASMADRCDYAAQLTESCRLAAGEAGASSERWRLVYQSRSGRPSDPWLEPDILDHLRALKRQQVADLIIAPIGFLSDHLEVLYDLDCEAADLCHEIGLRMVRAGTIGTHPRFVSMVRELIEERLGRRDSRRAIGQYGPSHDVCPQYCCLYPRVSPPASV